MNPLLPGLVELEGTVESAVHEGLSVLDVITPERCRTLYSKLRCDVSEVNVFPDLLVEKSVRIAALELLHNKSMQVVNKQVRSCAR